MPDDPPETHLVLSEFVTMPGRHGIHTPGIPLTRTHPGDPHVHLAEVGA